MPNSNLVPVNGIIQSVTPMENDCCSQMVSLRTDDGTVNFVISPATYVVQETRMRVGLPVTAFYDSTLPMPLIFPPQYQAVIISRRSPNETIYAGYFDENLVAEDGSLQLNLSRSTEIITSNGQRFTCNLGWQLLIVYYTSTTRSIPPQTSPRRIIVVC